MCPGDPTSPPGKVEVQPCSSLPAPEVAPVQAGDNRIVLTKFVPDATIKVYRNGTQVGESSGPVIILTQTVQRGDTLHVIQDLLECESQFALEIQVICVDPPVAGNPAWFNVFPVGWQEYDNGNGVRGIVYYPADDDGKDQPFNGRLGQSRSPIVLMAHGNHSPADPSYLGYRYFQHDLAKMGMIAVSIDCNALNGVGGGVQNIEDRADLIIDNISFFQGLDGNAASTFFQRIDFQRLGLMGHSRGGDAVVTVGDVAVAGVRIRSVLALAPTNFRFWFGLPTIQPRNYAFMTILPAGDGDVVDNNGAQFYDQARPHPYKSQVYAHFTNHNFFNREWLDDDSLWAQPQPPMIGRAEHERILTAYGSALFRSTLLGHSTDTYLSRDARPAGVMYQHVYLSFEREEVLTVDHHEDGNTINVNSLGQPTAQSGGMSADEFRFIQGAGAFNSSFYGETTGMVARPGRPGRIFRSALDGARNLSRSEIWIRAAEVTDGSNVLQGATGFRLGLEDDSGVQSWVDSDEVGGLPRPYDRDPGSIKSMLNTLRFKSGCFNQEARFNLNRVQAILIQCNRRDERALAFDDLQIVR